MSESIDTSLFVRELLTLLDETFEHHHGVYLDSGTSLFTTLDALTADDASRRGGSSGSIAAHTAHIVLYLDVIEKYMTGEVTGKIDWGHIWRTVSEVSPEEWDASRARLRATVARVLETLRGIENWEDEHAVGGGMAILAHTAYHLGAIRQAVALRA